MTIFDIEVIFTIAGILFASLWLLSVWSEWNLFLQTEVLEELWKLYFQKEICKSMSKRNILHQIKNI